MLRAAVLLISILTLAVAPTVASVCMAGCEPLAVETGNASHESAARHAHGSTPSQPEATDHRASPLHDTELCCAHGASALSTSRAAGAERRAIPNVASDPTDVGQPPRSLHWATLQASGGTPPPAPAPTRRVLRI